MNKISLHTPCCGTVIHRNLPGVRDKTYDSFVRCPACAATFYVRATAEGMVTTRYLAQRVEGAPAMPAPPVREPVPMPAPVPAPVVPLDPDALAAEVKRRFRAKGTSLCAFCVANGIPRNNYWHYLRVKHPQPTVAEYRRKIFTAVGMEDYL